MEQRFCRLAVPDALTSRPQPVYPLRMVSNWYKQFMAEAGVEVGSHKGEKRPPGPAMDLKNMRENGVRSLRVHCLHCGIERTPSGQNRSQGRRLVTDQDVGAAALQ